jgi:hypothetical protein
MQQLLISDVPKSSKMKVKKFFDNLSDLTGFYSLSFYKDEKGIFYSLRCEKELPRNELDKIQKEKRLTDREMSRQYLEWKKCFPKRYLTVLEGKKADIEWEIEWVLKEQLEQEKFREETKIYLKKDAKIP